MKKYTTLFMANIKMILRDKEAIFWMFLFPVLIMIITGSVFGGSGKAHLEIGLVDLDGSQVSKGISKALSDIDAFTVRKGSKKHELAELADGKLNAVLVLEEGFLESLKQGKPGSITIYYDKSNMNTSQIAAGTLSQVVSEFAEKMTDTPKMIEVTQKPVQTEEWSFVDFIVPGIIAMTLMMAGLMGLNMEIVKYREKGILRRIKVSPMPLSRFLGSAIFVSLITALIQTGFLILVGKLAFKINIAGNILNMMVVLIIGILAFQALGFLVASLSRTQKQAQMISPAITMPMMFLSGVFFPIQIMPTAMVVIAKCLPLYYLGDALRQIMINGSSLMAVWVDLVVLAGMGLFCFLVAVKFFRWE